MTPPQPCTSAVRRSLLVATFSSGAAALALELVWARELTMAFGASQYSVAVTLAAFMLGLGVGSALGGRLADRTRRPASLVAGLELVLALLGPVCSLAVLQLPPLAARLLPTVASESDPAFWTSRLLFAALALLLPTTVMGATFPVLVRAAARSLEQIPASVSALYGWNTVGGVGGALTAGFILLPAGGIPAVVAAAAACNLAAATAALVAGRGTDPTKRPEREPRTKPGTGPRFIPFLVAGALSGALVLGAEALWNRALEVTLANSTHTFTLLLAIFLAGLGGGGLAARRLLGRQRPLVLFAVLEALAAGVLIATAAWLPLLPRLVRAVRPDTGWARVLAAPLAAGGLFLLPFALIAGAAWPALLAAATPRLSDSGRRVGSMGLANALGAAAGPLLATWLLLPTLGFGRALLLLAALHAVLAAGACHRPSLRRAAGAAALLLAVLSFIALPRFGRVLLPSLVGQDTEAQVLFYRESPSAVVTVTTDTSRRFRSMFVDNNAAIGTTYDALKVTRMLGVLPVLLNRDPHSVLVVGLGAGVTTATVAGFPQVRQVEVAELVPEVAEAARLFEDLNHGVLDDARVRLVFNDGRNELLLTRRRYDIITCDPIHPLYGSAPLYSLDFFRLCHARLAPGGVMCQYLPLHHMPPREFRRTLATFCTAFPECRVAFGLGHGVLIGSDQPSSLDWNAWRARLRSHRFRSDLADSVLSSPGQIAALLALGPEECAQLAAPPPSTDLDPHLEFLAPAAFQPGLWTANARLLAGASNPPLDSIRGLPPALRPALERLIAGKRLLLESMLRLESHDLPGAGRFLRRALEVAPEDPELHRWQIHLGEIARPHGPGRRPVQPSTGRPTSRNQPQTNAMPSTSSGQGESSPSATGR